MSLFAWNSASSDSVGTVWFSASFCGSTSWAVLVTLFFGGYLAPWPFPAQLSGFIGILYGLVWFFAKTYFFIFVAIWMRTTLPRIRVDQLMGVAWKVLLPLALVNLFLTAIAVVAFKL